MPPYYQDITGILAWKDELKTFASKKSVYRMLAAPSHRSSIRIFHGACAREETFSDSDMAQAPRMCPWVH